jgi:SagB-type dehydrogenase family enzyme
VEEMRNLGTFIIIGLAFLLTTMIAVSEDYDHSNQDTSKAIKLPNARTDGGMSVEKALKERRSIRSFQDKGINLEDVSQLLWAAQGITDDKGHRTAPSAMATYPLEIYLLAGNVIGLPAGIYHYSPQDHDLTIIAEGNKIDDLFNISGDQEDWRKKAPAIFIITGGFGRMKEISGQDLSSFVYIEAGTAAENLLLEVVSLGLASTYTASFDANKIQELLGLSSGEEPIGVLPVGWKA